MKRKILSLVCCVAMLLSLSAAPVEATTEAAEGSKDALLAAIYEADLASLKLALDSGVLTSVELTQYYLDRIDTYNKEYNCFITICDDALEVAAQRDAQRAEGKAEGLLFGVPIVIKDNMDLAGYHTTNGFRKAANQIADENADVVNYLLREGAVIIAKGNMSTEAQDARRSSSQAVGETKNAYSIYMAAGGSSGGSAVSTSLNFTAAALGTDTNSSLRIPAALAGCVSLRPTFGLISVKGIKKLNGTRDVPGAITRSVYDQAIMLDVLTQGTQQYTRNLNPDRIRGMRIGVLKQLSYAISKTGSRTEENIDDEVAAAFENALKELEAAGVEIVEVSMSNLFTLSDKTHASNAQNLKDDLYEAFDAFLTENQIEAVVYPSYLSTPIRSGYDADGTYWDAYSQLYLNNCRTLSPSAGLPEICVPIGNHSLGAGIGMEIAARKNCEQLLLDIAYGYTTRYNHRQIPDGAPNTYADAYCGDLEAVVRNQQITDGMTGMIQWLVNKLQSEVDEDTTPLPSQQQTNQRSDTQWYWIIGGCLAAAVMIFVIVAVHISREKRRRRRRRRRQPVQ